MSAAHPPTPAANRNRRQYRRNDSAFSVSLDSKPFMSDRLISAPTEREAWDEFFDNYDLDPENIDVEVECIGEE